MRYRPAVLLAAGAFILVCLAPVGLLGWGIASAMTPEVKERVDCSVAAFNDDGSQYAFARIHDMQSDYGGESGAWVTRSSQVDILVRDLDTSTTRLLVAVESAPGQVWDAQVTWNGESVRYRAEGLSGDLGDEVLVPTDDLFWPDLLPPQSRWKQGRHAVPTWVCMAGVEDIAG